MHNTSELSVRAEEHVYFPNVPYTSGYGSKAQTVNGFTHSFWNNALLLFNHGAELCSSLNQLLLPSHFVFCKYIFASAKHQSSMSQSA